MSEDYAKLGLKAGLEIHQQLDTPKLFSGAPSFLRNDEPDYIIKRGLHVVAGETGDVDVAVRHEGELDKEFLYEGHDDTTTLVELDEEPPRSINGEALEESLKIALLLNCEIYPVAQVMRKTVIDGSNTSGFQRTVLIGHDGWVDTSFGKVLVESVALEEDSARVIKRGKDKVVYRLDRLGIPLVEIATAPVMHRPEEVKEAALKIGEILRACRVKRGIGTIRQDVNVSIRGHERVEIKGFQDVKMFVKTIDLEIERQLEDIENEKKGLKKEEHTFRHKKKWIDGEVRNALPDGRTEYLRPLPGKARMYPETDLELLKIDKKSLDRLKKSLPKLKEDIRAELKKKGLSEELINLVLDSNDLLDEFNALHNVYSRDANLIGKMITVWRKEISVKLDKELDVVMGILNERALERILERVKKNEIDAREVKEVMSRMVGGEEIEKIKVEKVSDDEVEEEIRKIIKEKPGLRPNAYMGLVMAKFKGKVDAKRAMEIIEKIVR